MASFECAVHAIDAHTAYLDASFTGGAAQYSNYRYVKLTLNGGSPIYIQSDEMGGADNDFYDDSISVNPGTYYNWTAVLCYVENGQITETSYTDSGSFRTPGATYTISATLTYSANGGSGAPASQTASGTSSSTTGTIFFTVPSTEPTRAGYVFDGWLCSANGLVYAPGVRVGVTGSTGGATYTMTAQWIRAGYQVYIGNGTTWERYQVFIGNGTTWEPYMIFIGDGSDWQPTTS